jgi:hypothetical protein
MRHGREDRQSPCAFATIASEAVPDNEQTPTKDLCVNAPRAKSPFGETVGFDGTDVTHRRGRRGWSTLAGGGPMSENEQDQDPGAPPEPPTSTESPAVDTSTDWDEWVERQVERPRPLSDVADEEGRFPELM